MTTLGKILVFLVFLGSLAFSAMIIVAFVARTNWSTGFERERQRADKFETNSLALVDSKNKLEAQKNVQIVELKNELDQSNKERELALNKQNKAEADLKNANQQLAAAQNTAKQLQATIENRETEVKNLDLRLTDIVKKNSELLDSTKKLAERAITAEIAFDSAKERNKNLMDQYQELLKSFEAYRLGDAARTRTLVRNPPPEDIKGSIKAVADKDGLVTINLGSDSGLARDHTLEVYRTKPNPQYVGMVRILDVRPNEAVGKLTLRRSTVQVGDEVASEIISKR